MATNGSGFATTMTSHGLLHQLIEYNHYVFVCGGAGLPVLVGVCSLFVNEHGVSYPTD